MKGVSPMYRKLAGCFIVAYDKLRGREAYQRRRYLERTQWLKRAELQRLQFERFRRLLNYAYENVPYYHELLKCEKLKPDDIRSLDDVRKIPILKKSTIRENAGKMLAIGFPKEEIVHTSTSGTTAAPLPFCRCRSDISWGVGAELRAYSWGDYEAGDKHGLIWIVKPSQARSLRFRVKNVLLRGKILDVSYLSEGSMESFAGKLHQFKPRFIRGYCSATNMFASFLLKHKEFKVNPEVVFTSGETLLPEQKKTIEEAFGCKVLNYYASSEMSHIAAQCGEHEGLHVTDENVLLEVVKNGETVSAKEEGKILLTNLHNYAMPFIRYDIGDVGKIYHEPCSCGRELTLLNPAGRTYEYFVNGDGSFTCLRDFQVVFEGLPIRDYQIVQEDLDRIVVKIVPRPEYRREHTEFILRHIKAIGTAVVRVELVGSLPLAETGKVKRFVSKIYSGYRF